MKILARGDAHGYFGWLTNLNPDKYPPEQTTVILLGDAGLNFYLNKTDIKNKRLVDSYGYYIYCLRGNHEARPQAIEGIEEIWDDNVSGYVYMEPQFPHIRYFLDWGEYTIGGYKCAMIGGAYSVDKWYRLARTGLTEETNNPKRTGWWPDEQLNEAEMVDAQNLFEGKEYDFVFTHTCPLSWQPTDLFLSGLDQSTVDNTMEVWMDGLKDTFTWRYWFFAHYHQDRIERPHVEQLYRDIEELDEIVERWKRYDETNKLDWWLQKSPFFNQEVRN